jgi:hypothetical protein
MFHMHEAGTGGLFGGNVMERCTVRGLGDYPALPHQILQCLKMTLFEAFPVYWSKPEAFEVKWAAALDTLGQMCKRLRKMNPL